MVYDIDMLRSFYSNFPKRVDAAREYGAQNEAYKTIY